jgi:hypothetical protein
MSIGANVPFVVSFSIVKVEPKTFAISLTISVLKFGFLLSICSIVC